ncbi:DUF2541 family protein, partial [Ligilactobacillus salivarius]|nr:DUF2541 family protein [Ligilactobacillus salivarius]
VDGVGRGGGSNLVVVGAVRVWVGWGSGFNINSDNDNKRCVSKITFSGHTVNSSDMATLKIIGDD